MTTTTTAHDTARQQWAHCRSCQHSWQTPIEVGAFVALLRSLRCPQCSADATELVLLETGRTRPRA